MQLNFSFYTFCYPYGKVDFNNKIFFIILFKNK